tara:strand:+ start:2370 stop:3086 length:717 start_codon:yes stop_codon:yes gene_type:complete
MNDYSFQTFSFEHNSYLLGLLLLWFILPLIGKKFLSKDQQRNVVFILIAVTLLQELLHYFFKINLNKFDIAQDLSLHMCGISVFISCYALYTKNQAAFELSFFWGLAGALQAVLTPDPTRFHFGYISTFWSFLSHGIIIMNVFWLIFVDNMRCRKNSLLNTILVTNGAIFIIGIINNAIGNGANYWFICEKPSGDSPFLIGEWPYYLFTFQLAGILFMSLIYLPMWFTVNRNKQLERP